MRPARLASAVAALAVLLCADPAAAFSPSLSVGLRVLRRAPCLSTPPKRLQVFHARDAAVRWPAMVAVQERQEQITTQDDLPVFQTVYPAQQRIIAIGDVHGDASALAGCLRLARLIDGNGDWRGGVTHLVQLGDVTDRGDGERECIDLLSKLRGQAEAVGGKVHVLLGNHEIMNADLDFRYVTPNAWKGWEFAQLEEAQQPAEQAAEEGKEGLGAVQSLGDALIELGWPSFTKDRVDYFRPGGRGSKDEISKMAVVLQIGDSVFVHGGLKLEHVRYGIERMNRETAAWLIGAPEFRVYDKPEVLESTESPMWLRSYSVPSPKDSSLVELDTVLRTLGAKRMVVGHTPQLRGINAAVTEEGREVWRCDTGMSAGMMSGPQEVLEILGDGRVRVITPESVQLDVDRTAETLGEPSVDLCDIKGLCTPANGPELRHAKDAQHHHLHPTLANGTTGEAAKQQPKQAKKAVTLNPKPTGATRAAVEAASGAGSGAASSQVVTSRGQGFGKAKARREVRA